MNKIVAITLATLAIVISNWAEAQSREGRRPVSQMTCGANKPLAFTVTLDPNGWDPNSGFTTPVDGRVFYNFSSARLICEGYTPDKIICIGFWDNGIDEEIAQVKIVKDPATQILSAHWRTNRAYGNKKIVSECRIEPAQAL